VKSFEAWHERGTIRGWIIGQHEVYLVVWVYLRSAGPGKTVQFTKHGSILKRSEFPDMLDPSIGSNVP
jgi:hypothetical protein